MTVKDLKTTEYNTYYQRYIDLIPKDIHLIEGFNEDSKMVLDFFQSVPTNKLNYAYAEGKWSIKEVFQHLIDTERVFQYRCFRIARHDKTPITRFEQDDYIAPSNAKNKSLEALIEEFKSVRQSFIVLLKSLSDDDLKLMGHASGSDLSARAAAFMNLGHSVWHIDVIKQYYL